MIISEIERLRFSPSGPAYRITGPSAKKCLSKNHHSNSKYYIKSKENRRLFMRLERLHRSNLSLVGSAPRKY